MHRRLLPPEAQLESKREAEPRKQCVPRQSLGTRVMLRGLFRFVYQQYLNRFFVQIDLALRVIKPRVSSAQS